VTCRTRIEMSPTFRGRARRSIRATSMATRARVARTGSAESGIQAGTQSMRERSPYESFTIDVLVAISRRIRSVFWSREGVIRSSS
jgi:hypothetical protein